MPGGLTSLLHVVWFDLLGTVQTGLLLLQPPHHLCLRLPSVAQRSDMREQTFERTCDTEAFIFLQLFYLSAERLHFSVCVGEGKPNDHILVYCSRGFGFKRDRLN